MTDIYRIEVLFDQPGARVILTFNDEKKALAEHQSLETAMQGPGSLCGVQDQYGIFSRIRTDRVLAVTLSHINEELNAEAELAILRAHGNASLQRRAAADPLLGRAVDPRALMNGGIPTRGMNG